MQRAEPDDRPDVRGRAAARGRVAGPSVRRCIQHIRQADKYQTVLFEDVRYSVPRQVAFEPVTVKAYIDQVVLVHKGKIVATHRRSRTAGEQVLEPHALPGGAGAQAGISGSHEAVQGTEAAGGVRRTARTGWKRSWAPRTGTRHYIRVLQLLGRHSAEQMAAAIEACLHRQALPSIEQKLSEALCSDALPARAESAASNHSLPIDTVAQPHAIVGMQTPSNCPP